MQRRAALLAVTALTVVPGLAFGQGLALGERRGIAAYQSEQWPGIEAAIQRAAGFPVPITVEWEQIARPGQAARYAAPDYYGHTIFDPLVAALTSITRDAMGRDALRAKLTRILIRYDERTRPLTNYPNGLTFEGGVLSINWEPGVNVGDRQPRERALVALLERNL